MFWIECLLPPFLGHGVFKDCIVAGKCLLWSLCTPAKMVSGGHSISSGISCSNDRQQKRQRWLQRKVGVIWTQRWLAIP